MSEEIIELKIDKLAGLGDGVGEYAGGKVFVPCTIAGDVVRARVVKRTSEATYAALEEVITPGEGRAKPVCRHFTRCGGCALQHLEQVLYLDFKQKMAEEAVRKAGFSVTCVKKTAIFPANTRRRAELKVKNGKIGFYAGRSRDIVDMEECAVLETELFNLVMQIKAQLSALPGIIAVQINGVDGGYDIVIEGNGGDRLEIPEALRISVRDGMGFRTVYQKGPVILALGNVAVDVPPGAFLQASRLAQELMTNLVKEAVRDAKKVLDLFAGTGTYAFPISEFAPVTAVESEKAMAEAMRSAAEKHGLSGRFKTEQQDLFAHPFSADALTDFDAVIINPPRVGAKAQSEQLAASRVPKIVMVSCNPATFARDARLLKEGGYRLQNVTPIDQFTYSPHLELVAEFSFAQ